jgi:hypothetical protein
VSPEAENKEIEMEETRLAKEIVVEMVSEAQGEEEREGTEREPPGELPPKLPPELRTEVVSERGGERDLKAVKADDAAVPIWLWNDAIVAGLSRPPACRGHTQEQVDRALETLRMFALSQTFRSV